VRGRVVLHLKFCLVFFYSLATGQTLSPVQINEKYSRAIVLIKTDLGTGTGFIVSPDGTIATAFHVIKDAKKVGVKTATGDVFDQVLLLAKDERKDVAVLKIAGYDLPSVERENSNDLKVGERVAVIGNPLGEEALRSSVTDGIVSGLRDLGDGYKVIQISAPISHGNSGGPVFSERGKVVGIATFALVAGENLNFAVPSNYLTGLLDLADKAHPLETWTASGSDTVFAAGPRQQTMTGYWKSTCGSVYRIQDTGSSVRVVNMEYIRFTYDLKWDGSVIFGEVTGRGRDWFFLKRADPDHFSLWSSKAKHDETRDQALARLRSKSDAEKPECRWVKVGD
jgi:V8-like Glu-specific endopeptidase